MENIMKLFTAFIIAGLLLIGGNAMAQTNPPRWAEDTNTSIATAQGDLDAILDSLNIAIDSTVALSVSHRRDVARDSVLVKTNTTDIATLQTALDALITAQWNSIRVVVNFSAGGPWEEETPHELFTVTGYNEFYLTAICSTAVTSTNATDSLHFFLLATTTKMLSVEGDNLGIGEVLPPLGWSPDGTAPTQAITLLNGRPGWHGCVSDISAGSASWDYDIDGGAFTGGILVFTMLWRPMAPGSTISAGAGS